MSAWTRPPEPIEWTLPHPVTLGSATYNTVTLRAPTAAELLKATAVPGEETFAQTLRLVAAVSSEGIPFEALLLVDTATINQMARYFDLFDGAPLPVPLQEWLANRLAGAKPQPA